MVALVVCTPPGKNPSRWFFSVKFFTEQSSSWPRETSNLRYRKLVKKEPRAPDCCMDTSMSEFLARKKLFECTTHNIMAV
jgi:hypothetical protein